MKHSNLVLNWKVKSRSSTSNALLNKSRMLLKHHCNAICHTKALHSSLNIIRPMFINKFDLQFQNLKICTKISEFPDDTKLCREIGSELDVKMLQEDLKRLSLWSEDCQLLFNVEKCSVMHIGKTERGSQIWIMWKDSKMCRWRERSRCNNA